MVDYTHEKLRTGTLKEPLRSFFIRDDFRNAVDLLMICDMIKEAGMSVVNREHKDRLFKFIFGNPEHREWTLMANRAEVKYMFITEYDEERTRREDRADGWEGGGIKMLDDLVRKNLLTEDIAAREAGVSVEIFRELAAKYSEYTRKSGNYA